MIKVYFEDYRFSEDLDFTLLDRDISNEQIFEGFSEVFEYIRDEANIPLEIIDNNEHEAGEADTCRKELLRMVKSVNLEGVETSAFFKEKFDVNQFPSRGDLLFNLGIGFCF